MTEVCRHLAEVCADLQLLAQRFGLRGVGHMLGSAKDEAERVGEEIERLSAEPQ